VRKKVPGFVLIVFGFLLLEFFFGFEFLVDGLSEDFGEFLFDFLGEGFLVDFVEFGELGVSLLDGFGDFLSFGNLCFEDFFGVIEGFL
jgi:hypothetical protein